MTTVSCYTRHEPRQRKLTAADLGVRVAGNGSLHILAWCDECQRWSSSAIPASYVRSMDVSIDMLPVVADHRGFFAVCSVRGCWSDDVELNHFAPRGIFGGEADDWPTAYLCRKHHQEWGERVTPSLNPPQRRGAA